MTRRKPNNIVVLFGLGEDGTPRGARFPDDDQPAMSKLALALGLRVGIAAKTAHLEFAQKLPIGRPQGPSGNSVPKISKDLYDQINALVGGDVGKLSTKLAKSFDEIAPGHVVLAQESIADGWFEAVVVRREAKRLIVRWRDYPDVPPFERSVDAVSLLHGE